MGKVSTGLGPNVAGLLCYLLGWISGLVFFILEKDNKFVRFHALQSIVTFGALTVVFALVFVPIVGWIFSWLTILIAFILWIILMIKAYRGRKYKLPLAGEIAEKQA
jgi:uncharacterized membrane protein